MAHGQTTKSVEVDIPPKNWQFGSYGTPVRVAIDGVFQPATVVREYFLISPSRSKLRMCVVKLYSMKASKSIHVPSADVLSTW